MSGHGHGGGGVMKYVFFIGMAMVSASMFVGMMAGAVVWPFVAFLAKIQTICGLFVLAKEAGSYYAHHHNRLAAFGCWVACAVFVVGLLVWSPQKGVHSPIPDFADLAPSMPQFAPAGTPAQRQSVPNFGTANTGGGSTAAATPATTSPAKKKTVVYSTLSSVESQKDIAPLDCDAIPEMYRRMEPRCSAP